MSQVQAGASPTPDNTYLLQVEALTVSFDGFKAIDDLSMYVDRNEVRAVIGPNGAGKTTLLDLISGKTKPSSGKVTFANREMTGLPEHVIVQAGIGRKFQTPSVYEQLSVFENLEMSYPEGRSWWGAFRFKRSPEVVAKVEEIAEFVYLKDRLEAPAGELSHGQKQWLEIGMLVIQDPALMMLDEPVAGMSVADREQTVELIKSLSDHRSIIVVEHDMEFVEKIAHKVTVLHQGKWLAEGKMDVVQNDPKVIDVYLGH